MYFFTDSYHSPGGQESLYLGDIKLTEKQQENMKKYGNPYGPQSRAASNVPSERWPNAVIPYTFDCSVGEQKKNLFTCISLNCVLYKIVIAPLH